MRRCRKIYTYFLMLIISTMLFRVQTYIYQPIKKIPKDLSKLHFNPKHHSFYYPITQINKQLNPPISQIVSPSSTMLTQKPAQDKFLDEINDYVRKKAMLSQTKIINKPLAQSYSTQTLQQYSTITNIPQNNKNILQNQKINNSQNYVEGKDNLINGINNKIQGQNNIAKGNQNNISGNQNKVLGNSNYLSGNTNIVSGSDNIVNGHYNVIIGQNNAKQLQSLANQLKERFNSIIKK